MSAHHDERLAQAAGRTLLAEEIGMDLEGAVQGLGGLDREAILFVKRPWHAASTCQAVVADDQFAASKSLLEGAGYAYFLEVSVIKEVLEVLESRPAATSADKVMLLIHYAEHDAFPDWVCAR